MSKRYVTWIAALVVAMLVAGCGPEMATPTPRAQTATAAAISAVPVQTVAMATATPTVKPVAVEDLPVDAEDFHALGPADAAVTLVEYSDFQ